MNRNTNLTLFTLMALEMAIIAEILNNSKIFVVWDIETELPDLSDYDDYDMPQPPTEEEVINDWLVNECGLSEDATYAPNERFITLSLAEMRQIKREMDILRVRANEGEELAREVRGLHEKFFPQA